MENRSKSRKANLEPILARALNAHDRSVDHSLTPILPDASDQQPSASRKLRRTQPPEINLVSFSRERVEDLTLIYRSLSAVSIRLSLQILRGLANRRDRTQRILALWAKKSPDEARCFAGRLGIPTVSLSWRRRSDVSKSRTRSLPRWLAYRVPSTSVG
jgi:hypothetical protein